LNLFVIIISMNKNLSSKVAATLFFVLIFGLASIYFLPTDTTDVLSILSKFAYALIFFVCWSIGVLICSIFVYWPRSKNSDKDQE
jgi:FtsH-binding integral membrane protein